MATALVCLIGFAERNAIRGEERGDPFRPDTVWKGEIIFDKTDYTPKSKPLTMVLFVKRRDGAQFEAVTWYPSRRNLLILVKGEVGGKGAITFVEEKVIHGEMVAGMKFEGQREGTTISASGEWTGPAFNGPIRATFHLKLAE